MKESLMGAARSTKPYVLALLALVSFAQVFDIAWTDVRTISTGLWTVATSARPLFLGLGILFAFFLVSHVRHRKTPITVLSGRFDLWLEDENAERCKLVQETVIRANHPDVTGYRQKVNVAPGRLKAFEGQVSHAESNTHVISRGGLQDLIHWFDKPLPRTWWKLNTDRVTRRGILTIDGGAGDGQESFEVSTTEYPFKKLTMTVWFPSGVDLPSHECCRGMRIRRSAVKLTSPERVFENGRAGLRLTIGRSAEEFHVIEWKVRPRQTPAWFRDRLEEERSAEEGRAARVG